VKADSKNFLLGPANLVLEAGKIMFITFDAPVIQQSLLNATRLSGQKTSGLLKQYHSGQKSKLL
jgi:hypothetical protein